MTKEPITNWQDAWESNAKAEKTAFLSLSEDQLLEKLSNSKGSQYFQIWKAFEETGGIEKSALALWQFLKGNPGDKMILDRYHCAAALFKILGLENNKSEMHPLRKKVQWDHQGEKNRQESLLDLKKIIDKKILNQIKS